MAVHFDQEGHLTITPQQLLQSGSEDQRGLVDDVLCHGTPAIFDTYRAYRAFVHEAAESLRISPFSIWIRGSAHIGFSISPRAGKIWVQVGDDSDIDLAIVDPDHYHLLDGEIRRWERTDGTYERGRVKRLRDGRRFYCYRHDDLPSSRETTACNEYKERIAEISRKYNGRDITAFFFRDTWALHERYVKDIRDLVFQSPLGLPAAGDSPRPRMWLEDRDLAILSLSRAQLELNLARKPSNRRMGITDAGLRQLRGLGLVQRLWLDGCDVSDDGIASLGASEYVTFLSLADTTVTEACLQSIVRQFPNLQVLVLDDTQINQAAFRRVCGRTNLVSVSARGCWSSEDARGTVRNSQGIHIRMFM